MRIVDRPAMWLAALVMCLNSRDPAQAVSATMPAPFEESISEPVRYGGEHQPDKRYYDGALPHAVGVHCFQAYRANRTSPPEGGNLGWTYNHAPYLAYWNDRFYLQFLSCLTEEHVPPGRTLISISRDGRQWSAPRVAFPIYTLPETGWRDHDVAAGTFAVMSQRMGFYIAPNGRLLTPAFYSFCPTPRVGPNLGQGLGRVVREIRADGSFGPIYFLRYNQDAGWSEKNTRYPFYTESPDQGFVAACKALLADKLMTLQWWEHDRGKDGFFPFEPKVTTKALSYYHRPDGVVVALWKHQLSALSADEGKTWSEVVRCPTLLTCGAKVWGQRTEDSRFALVFCHSATRRNRFPLAVMTGQDGRTFDTMLCLHGQVPPIRYQGIHKNIGFQYVRGIVEGNGDPPGQALWNTFGMNKEDIWVSRTRLPLAGGVAADVGEDFEGTESTADLEHWNLHVPQWAPVSIEDDPFAENKCLQLVDEEPYDYAWVERAFPSAAKAIIRFRVVARQIGHAIFAMEVHDRAGHRPLRLRIDPSWLSLDRGSTAAEPVPISTGKWYEIVLTLDCAAQSYDLAMDGTMIRRGVAFAEPVETLERLVFRTGPWRGDVRSLIVDGEPNTPGLYMEDLPGADRKVARSVFCIDDVTTRSK